MSLEMSKNDIKFFEMIQRVRSRKAATSFRYYLLKPFNQNTLNLFQARCWRERRQSNAKSLRSVGPDRSIRSSGCHLFTLLLGDWADHSAPGSEEEGAANLRPGHRKSSGNPQVTFKQVPYLSRVVKSRSLSPPFRMMISMVFFMVRLLTLCANKLLTDVANSRKIRLKHRE